MRVQAINDIFLRFLRENYNTGKTRRFYFILLFSFFFLIEKKIKKIKKRLEVCCGRGNPRIQVAAEEIKVEKGACGRNWIRSKRVSWNCWRQTKVTMPPTLSSNFFYIYIYKFLNFFFLFILHEMSVLPFQSNNDKCCRLDWKWYE